MQHQHFVAPGDIAKGGVGHKALLLDQPNGVVEIGDGHLAVSQFFFPVQRPEHIRVCIDGYLTGAAEGLKVPYDVLEKRLKSLKRRGVIFEEGQTLRDIYDIRCPLYEKYADIVIETDNETDVQETAVKIADICGKQA